MTEIERILQSGNITPAFLEPETLSEFHVDSSRKKLWAISLDLLIEFDRVCKKHGLRYYLGFGSLLGAIRHKGFIPWDDDVDVFMFREDYEKFAKLGDEFSHPYFLQTPYTDSNYFYSNIKLRNTNTTALVETFKYQNFNHGIWLSIFPLDRWSLENGEEKYNQIKSLLKECSTFMRMSNPNLSEQDKVRVKNYSGRNPLSIYEEIQQIATSCKDHDTTKVACIVCTVDPYDKLVYNESDFDDVEYVPFENLSLPVPAGYHNILKDTYGNYMEFPPVDQRGTWHQGLVIDPDKPYKDYL